jgi:hypothetical protein
MTKTVIHLAALSLALLTFLSPIWPYEGTVNDFDPRKFGAKADGHTKDTAAVQAAIDRCADQGGGTVRFAPGIYLCGSLHLRSNVTLSLEAMAVIRGSTDREDYDPYETLPFKNDADKETSFFHLALMWGEDLENVSILGPGTIDGNRPKRGGAKPIALKRCRHVRIEGITIRNSPNYCISLLGTDYVNIDGVNIFDAYCDGIDPDCCRHVRISNCHIESWDDAIVPKASFTLGERRSTEFITVTNCQLATACNCFKLGTESGGDFKYITVSNCVMLPFKGLHPISGIALESVDGSNISGVAVSNISMVDVQTPIFLRLGNRGRDMEVPTPGTLRNVLISNVVAEGATQACSITGIPGHPVEGVTLADIRLTFQGGGRQEDIHAEVPEMIARYPDADMFEKLPAYGLYCRHAADLTVRNLQLLTVAEDPRHALFCEDVTGLDIDDLSAPAAKGGAAMVGFMDVREALIRGCRLPVGVDTFLSLAGGQSGKISLTGNDLLHAARVVDKKPEVDAAAVRMTTDLQMK